MRIVSEDILQKLNHTTSHIVLFINLLFTKTNYWKVFCFSDLDIGLKCNNIESIVIVNLRNVVLQFSFGIKSFILYKESTKFECWFIFFKFFRVVHLRYCFSDVCYVLNCQFRTINSLLTLIDKRLNEVHIKGIWFNSCITPLPPITPSLSHNLTPSHHHQSRFKIKMTAI